MPRFERNQGESDTAYITRCLRALHRRGAMRRRMPLGADGRERAASACSRMDVRARWERAR